MELTPQQRKRLEKIAKLLDEGEIALAEFIFDLEEKIEAEIPSIKDVISRVKGEKGDTYTLTDEDKKEIASVARTLLEDELIARKAVDLINIDEIVKRATPKIDLDAIAKKVKVPVVEKVIEKTEVIRETPIITEVVKEVAVADNAFDIRNKLELLEGEERLEFKAIKESETILKDISELKARPNPQTWGRGGGGNVEVFASGTKVGSGSALNFIGATITHDGHTANITVAGAESDTLQTVTGRGATTTIESTFSGGLITNQVKANSSAGLIFKSNAGTTVADFGAGGGSNATFYGGVNIDGALGLKDITITGHGSITLDGNIYHLNTVGATAAGLHIDALYDSSSAASLNLQSRTAYYPDGTTVAFTWGNSSAIAWDVSGFWGGALGGSGGAISTYDSLGNTVYLCDNTYAINAAGNSIFTGDIEAGTITKTGGTASEFLKADGSVDNSTYFVLPTLTSGSVLFSNGTTIAQDNANFFWDDSNNRFGLGTNSPASRFHISDGNSVNAGLYGAGDYQVVSANNLAIGLSLVVADNTATALNRGVFKGVRARGTLASPTAAASEDSVLSFLGAIYDGSTAQGTAQVSFTVDGSVSAGVAPQRIGFFTSATNAASRTERLTIKSDGKVGIGTTSPFSLLNIGDTPSTAYTTTFAAFNQGLTLSSSSLGVLGVFETTGASSAAGGGAFVGLYSNDGAALASGDRIGGFLFGGSASSTLTVNSAAWVAFANGGWSGSSAPTDMVLQLAPSGSVSRTEVFRAKSDRNFGFNTAAPSATGGGIDIASGGLSLIIGADNNNNSTRTNSTLKAGRTGLYHYTNAEEPVAMFLGTSDSTTNTLNIGGGTGIMNAMTAINFYTAANNTTTTGTIRMTVDSAGNVGIGTTSPDTNLDVEGSSTSSDIGTNITNLGNGTGARARLSVSSGTTNFGIYANSPLYTGISNWASKAVMYGGTNTIALTFIAGKSDGYLQFSAGGLDPNTYEAMRITSSLNVGIGTKTPNANAILDVQSTTKAFMPPRMTTTQKNNIASPTAGMVVYDSTLNKLCVYTTAWETVTSV